MAKTADKSARRVVIGPGVFARSFFVGECHDVLQRWRNGKIRPVVTRDLLAAYVRVFRALGLPDVQLRKWLYWFTSKETSDFLPEPAHSQDAPLPRLLFDAAQRGHAEFIVTSSPADSLVRVTWARVNQRP